MGRRAQGCPRCGADLRTSPSLEGDTQLVCYACGTVGYLDQDGTSIFSGRAPEPRSYTEPYLPWSLRRGRPHP